MDEGVDVDLESLRLHDPASEAHAPAALRQRILGIPAGSAEPLSAVHGSRRRTSTWPAAAAVVAMLALSAGASLFSSAAPSAAPTTPLTIPSPADPAAPITLNAASSSAAGADSILGWGGNYRFRLPRFSTAAGTAHVYALDTSQLGQADAARFAKALGMVGEPEQRDPRTIILEAPAGGGPLLGLEVRRGGVWYFSATESPYQACSAPSGNDPSKVEQCLTTIPLPTTTQVEEVRDRLLAVMGLTPDEVQVTTETTQERTTTITARRVIDDMTVNLGFRAVVSHDGLLSFDGDLGALVDLGPYDTVSPARAAARLNSAAFGPSLVEYSPVASSSPPSAIPQSTERSAPRPGSPVPWSISTRTIVSGWQGLSSIPSVSSGPFIVPAYAFTDTEGNVWSAIALEEKDLDATAFPWLPGEVG